MVKTITREQYENYVTEWVAYTEEQWLKNGIEIVFTLECDYHYYYLTVEVASHVYDFYNENSDYNRGILEETEKFCKEFGCKICTTLDEVNRFVSKELPSYCEFEEAYDGTIYGN